MNKLPSADDFYGIGIVDGDDPGGKNARKANEQEIEDALRSEEFLVGEDNLDREDVQNNDKERLGEIPHNPGASKTARNATEKARRAASGSGKSKRVQHFDSSVVAAIERIRNLLGDNKFYDPDAQPSSDHFIHEGDWTEKDLTVPALKSLQRHLQRSDPKSALEAVKEIRAEETTDRLKQIAAYDRDGSLLSLYRIWSLIPPVYKYDPEELAQMLARRVLYNQDDIIAINKPYGISTKFSTTEGGRMAISSVLGKLQPLIAPNSERLYVVHRLDKCTTGVLLLASSRLRATELCDMFKERKIQKKYWTLVRGIPDPDEGIIDIPLKETKVGGRFKTIPVIRRGDTLEPYGRQDPPPSDIGSLQKVTPVTEYKVVKTGQKCALVECVMRSGFTHQIRCHLGFGLGTPVIGDHKYSDFLQYLPQRLPPEMLYSLAIRSAKSRSMPMHLHAREVLIPEYSNGRNVQIRSLLPKYFVYVLRRLKISLK